MFGQVMPISCRKNVTMLFSDKSLGTCTPLRSPSSQLRKPLEHVRRRSCRRTGRSPAPSPFSRLFANFIGSSAMSLTTFLILATTAQNAAGGMPSSSSSPSMMNLTGSSMKRWIALAMRPTSPPAFLRRSAISARTSSTAALERVDELLVEVVARGDRPARASLSSWPSNFACSSAAQSPQRLRQRRRRSWRCCSRALLMMQLAGRDDGVDVGRDLGELVDHAVGEVAARPCRRPSVAQSGRPVTASQRPTNEAADARVALVDALPARSRDRS